MKKIILFLFILFTMGLFPLCADITTGLVGYWSFDETGGSQAIDNSGNGNTGTIYGASRVPGVSGNALSFDGIDDYVSCGNNPVLNPQQAITLCAWYKPVSSFSGSGNDPIIDKGYYSHSNPYYQYHLGVTGNLYNNTGYFRYSFQAATPEYDYVNSNNPGWGPGHWYFLAGTYDGSTMKLYVNGDMIEERAVTGTIADYGKPLYVGKFNNLNAYLKGVVDDVRIYSRALDEAEVRYLYNPPPALRKFPYPYKAGLTICSDIDVCSRDEFLAIHQFLNTKSTLILNGKPVQGVGLEIGDTFWMYDATPGSDEFSYFSGTGNTVSGDADLIRTMVHAGYLDCLHSFGNFCTYGGFTRQMGLDALVEMEKAHMVPEVYIDHGDEYNRDNVGYPTGRTRVYQMGDVPGEPEYHTDMSVFPAGPIKYLWKSDSTGTIASEPITTVVLGDGRKIHAFSRYNASSPYWLVENLYNQISPAILAALIAGEGYLFVPNHLGHRELADFFSPSNISALQNLGQMYENGEIYVTNTFKLLRYNQIHNNLVWSHEGDCQSGLTIRISAVQDSAFGDYIPTIDELQGITFYTDCPAQTSVYLDTTDITGLMQINPPDHTGQSSVSVPLVSLPVWPEWTSNGYTRKTENYQIPDYNYTFSITNIDTVPFAPTLHYTGLHSFSIEDVKVDGNYLIYIPDSGNIHLPLLDPGDTLSGILVTNGNFNPAIPRLTGHTNPAIRVEDAFYNENTEFIRLKLDGVGNSTFELENCLTPFDSGCSRISASGTMDADFTLNGEVIVQTIGMEVLPSGLSVALMVTTWQTTGSHYRCWAESVPPGISVIHTIRDLQGNTSYHVLVDGVITKTCQADNEGRIDFTLADVSGNLLIEIIEA